ncbi:MAG: hypothetical protein JO322_06765 [Candidatus Eremiobacteraeota bacterium]|nr:hypothetical protein [Candidatus Eremiobacteraeota bacterium]
MQTQALKDHVKAICDELKSAGDKQDEQAKTAVRAAMTHVEEARKAIETQTKSDATEDNKERQQMLDHLQTVAQSGATTLKADGANLRKGIRDMLNATEDILTKDM